jgi:peroxiredoxin
MTTRHIPNFRTAASTGQTLSWSSFEGKVPVLMLCMPDGINHELMQNADALHSRFGDHRVQVLAVAPLTAREAREESERSSFTIPILSDPNRELLDGVGGGTVGILYDRDGQEVRTYDLTDTAVTADTILQDVSSMVIDGSLTIMEGGQHS